MKLRLESETIIKSIRIRGRRYSNILRINWKHVRKTSKKLNLNATTRNEIDLCESMWRIVQGIKRKAVPFSFFGSSCRRKFPGRPARRTWWPSARRRAAMWIGAPAGACCCIAPRTQVTSARHALGFDTNVLLMSYRGIIEIKNHLMDKIMYKIGI